MFLKSQLNGLFQTSGTRWSWCPRWTWVFSTWRCPTVSPFTWFPVSTGKSSELNYLFRVSGLLFFFSIYDDLNCRHLARMLLWNTMFGGIKVKVQLHFTRSSFTIRASGENFIGSGINHPQKEQRDWCHPSLVYTEFDSVVFIDIDDILWVAFLFSNIKSSLKAWIWITGRLLEKRKWLCCHVTRAMNSDLQILSTYKIQICFYVKCLLYPMESQMWKKS